MREPVTGKVVFITGAARGIGAETAWAAAARGARLTDAYMRVAMPGVVPNIESEVQALGRRFSERTLTGHALTAPRPADEPLGAEPGGPSALDRSGTEAGEHGRLDDPDQGIGEQ
jgi:NAD(P)-dependent dehydrogenase (short-subunit alcohol dehydrogenase family)